MRFGVVISCVALVGAQVACGSRLPRRCSERADCGEQQYCDAVSRLCVLNEPPIIELASPRSGDVLSADTLEVSGRAKDDEDLLATLEYSADRGASWHRIATTQRGEFVEKIPLPRLDYKPFPVLLRATDEQGASAVSEVAIAVDVVPPTCGFVALEDGAAIPRQDPPVLPIELHAEDGAGITTVELWVDANHSLPLVPTEPGRFLAMMPIDDAANGRVHSLLVRARDSTGLECEAALGVRTDQRPPLITIDTPHPETVIAKASLVRVGGSVSDEGNAVQVSVDFDDGIGVRPAIVNGERWHVDVPLPPQDLQSHRVSAVASDTAGNLAQTELVLRVDTQGPRFGNLSPPPNGLFNASHFPSNNQLVLNFEVSDEQAFTLDIDTDPGGLGRFWSPLPAETRSYSVTTSASDNGQRYSFAIRAIDASGNRNDQLWSVQVDRVSPTVTLEPPNGARNTELEALVRFSEQVAPETTIRVEPAAPQTSFSFEEGDRFRSSRLEHDTVYVVTVPDGGAQDVFGNAFRGPASTTFRTKLARPDAGSIGLSGITRFDVAADQDGAAVVVWYVGVKLHARFFDPKTGMLAAESAGFVEPWDPNGSAFQAHAWRRVDDAGTDLRIRGFSGLSPYFPNGSAYWKAGTTPGSVTSDSTPVAFLPLPPPCSSGANSSVAYYKGSEYYRGGTRIPELDLQIQPSHSVYRSENHWVGVAFDGGTILQQGIRCTCSGAQPTCTRDGVATIEDADPAALSSTWNAVALPNGAVIHAFSPALGGAMKEVCIPASGLRTTSTIPAGHRDVRLGVAPDGGVFRHMRNASGELVIDHRTFDRCFVSLPSTPRVVAPSGATSFRSVRLADKPAALILRSGSLEVAY